MLLRTLVVGVLVLSACGDDDPSQTTTGASSTSTAPAPTTTTGPDPTTGAGDDTTTTGDVTTTAPEPGSTSSTATGDPLTGDLETGDGSSGTGDTTTGDGGVVPPLGDSSHGAGGGPAAGDLRMTGTGVEYRVIAPAGGGPRCLMLVYSGVEGGQTMTQNLLMIADFTGNGECLFAVLDGKDYNGDGQAGADVLDDMRAAYDVDNDRTYLLSESAGTTAGLELGLQLRQSYFAAYWANDVNASAAPALAAAELGFMPWGNAGPGGKFAQAQAIVDGMAAAGYRLAPPAPYDGPGADQHGSPDQFIAAMSWFPGRTRQ
jgi:hypothetical protein